VARGREVYIAEGCIHCHSQYLRPDTRDELWWGPRDATPSDGTPSLIGTRRLGPDLSRVGNRRSPQWQRLHLIDPRAFSPASRMPSYAHLFARASTRGDDLVAYLTSLGAEDVGARYEMTQHAPLAEPARPARAERGARVFARWCSSCHGPQGRGDGSAAADLRRPSMNLRKPSFWLISWGADAEPEQAAVERVVRFGISGTSMPGHEYLTDEQVADVATYVLGMRGLDIAETAD